MQDRILVTGATSNLGGRELIKQLSLKGAIIRAAAHSLAKANKLDYSGIETVEVDYDKPDTLKQAFVRMDRLYLLTPFKENMVEMTENLVEQSIESGIKHIVKQSIINADKDRNTFTRLHKKAENIIIDSGIPFTFLRPNYFMQNFSSIMGLSIKKMNSISILTEKGNISYVDVRDVAAVATEVLTKDNHFGQTYTLTGPEAISISQVIDILSRVRKKPIKTIIYSEDAAKKWLKAAGFSDWYLNILQEIAEAQENDYLSIISSDIEKIIGRKPISFAQFAEDHAYAF